MDALNSADSEFKLYPYTTNLQQMPLKTFTLNSKMKAQLLNKVENTVAKG